MVATRIASTNLVEFFRDRVREALENQKLRPPEGVEFYLVNLLKEYLKAEELFATTDEGRRQEPLALLLGEALQSDPHTRIRIFKRIGDLSLFTAGFFPDSLRRQLVDVAYYVQMGEAAYEGLSQLLARQRAFEEIFTELAERFIGYVDVLSEVSEKSSMISDADLLRLYETWLKTGSERAKQLLSREGILPIPNLSRKLQ